MFRQALRCLCSLAVLGLGRGFIDTGAADQNKPSEFLKLSALSEEKCNHQDPLYIVVSVGVFGDLVDFDAHKEDAQRWLFVTIVDSMTRSDSQSESADVSQLVEVEPVLTTSSNGAFEVDSSGKVSPLQRHYFRTEFTSNECEAHKLVGNICRDYVSKNQVLLTAVLRSLDNAVLYPLHGLDVASRYGGINSALSVTVSVLDKDRHDLPAFGCGKSFSEGSAQSQLFLPVCPAHAVPCEPTQKLCSEAQRAHAPWSCACEMGYEGDLSIPGLNVTDAGLQFHFVDEKKLTYTGQCEPRKGYCNVMRPYPDEDGTARRDMVREDGSPADGTIGEVATPTCPEGTRDSGSSSCAPDTQDSGKWQPYRKCTFIPPLPPPPPAACPALDGESMVLSPGCDSCRPMDPDNPQEFKECSCKPTCKEGFKHTAGPAEGESLTCEAKPYACPDEKDLRWDMQARSCRSAAGEAVHELCCKEAWDGNKPKPLKKLTCSALSSEVDCLTARDAESGLPCCFRDEGYAGGQKCVPKGSKAITADHPSDACAVGPDMFFGEWHEIPTCAKVCPNEFGDARGIVQEGLGCDNLLPSETCEIQCAPGFENYGLPELVGKRECGADLSLGAPPTCLKPPPVPQCEELWLTEAPLLEVSGFCRGCHAGTEECEKCEVHCVDGSKAIGGGAEGVKQCLLIKNPELELVADCSGIQEQEECTQSAQDANSPCCWREDSDDGDGAGQCMPKNSAGITTDVLCTMLKSAEFEELPLCEVMCPNSFLEPININTSNIETVCSSCTPSESQLPEKDCPCSVECASGFERYGGGSEGKKKCLAGKTGPSFEPGPICDVTEPPATCPPPSAPSAQLSAGCSACLAGEDCKCEVTCPTGYKRVSGGNEGPKACVADAAALRDDAECTALTTFEDCTGSKDSASGEPCCFNEDGLTADGAKCVPKLAASMAKLPQRWKPHSPHPACAPMQTGVWTEAMPVCEQVVSTSGWELVHGIDFDAEKCSSCVLSEPCDCEVTCKAGLERYGGGPEGKRQPIAGKDGSPPSFGEAPLCLPPEPAPRCDSPEASSSVIVSSACSTCTADANDCDCIVECAAGYAPLGEVGSYVPKKHCHEVAAVVSAQVCAGLDKADCLTSAEGGQPCGFTEDGKCFAKGSQDLKATDSKAEFTKLRHYEWDAMPSCHLLCVNTFASNPLVEVVGDCDTCFAGERYKAECEGKCEVECAAGTKFSEGFGAHGKKSCDDLGDFGQAPNCVPVSPTVENPKCPAPPNSKRHLEMSEGCSHCTAGESGCDCTVTCASELLAVTPELEGAKECELVYYSCPKVTEFDEAKKICKDKATDTATEYFCCWQAWYTTEPKMEPTDCTAITDETECLNSKDASTDKACCWFADGATSAGADPKVCVPAESSFIDDDHLPRQCANRKPVKKFAWQPMPECAPICNQDFTSTSSVVAKDCDKCHGHDKNDCNCEVQCEEGLEHYGRGPVGPRKCDPKTSTFGLAPLCLPKPSPPECTLFVEPEIYQLTNCADCVAGDTENCGCEIHCNSGYTHKEGSREEGPIQCELLEKELADARCQDVDSSTACMRTSEAGSPCCWVNGACAKKGSEDILEKPSKCADDPEEHWPETPVCLSSCSYTYIATMADVWFFDYDGCYGCVTDDDQCSCEVTCRRGYKRVGGGEEGHRQCSSSDVEFRNPPICMYEESFDPEPVCQNYPKLQNVVTRGCTFCTADNCHCSATCYRGCSPVGSGVEGSKACKAEDSSLTDVSTSGGCESLTDAASCLESIDASKDATCCWNDDEGWCAAMLSDKIVAPPDECAARRVGFFEDEDEPLECAQKCTHDFPPADDAYDYDEEVCGKCVVTEHDCKCEIRCNAENGYERVGGGAEGPRTCTLDDTKMERAPVCMKKPDPPTCPAGFKKAKEYKVTGCDCEVDKPCDCSVECADGYVLIGEKEEVSCVSEKEPDTSGGELCENRYADECATSQENGVPCCYKSYFLGMGGRCLPKGSDRITELPDECAKMTVAAWHGLPTCKPVCPNVFKDDPDLIVQDCDDCVPGEPCNCQVHCKDGTVAMRNRGGNEGLKKCFIHYNTMEAGFDLAPVCQKRCPVPDTLQGTLDVSQCQEPCFPGEDCSCRVYCAKNNHRVHGGREGSKLRCQEEAGIVGFRGLPICLPQCSQPDDQQRTLYTSKCSSICDAGSECKCKDLKCYGHKKGGGPEGDRICMLFPGQDGDTAVARWVNVEDDECTGKTWETLPKYCQDLPSCMSPFAVTVINARTKKVIPYADVHLIDPEGVAVTDVQVTDEEGKVEFHTSLVNLKIKVTKDCEGQICYNQWLKEFDRVAMCNDAKKCGTVAPISQKLENGYITKDGCYLLLDDDMQLPESRKSRQKWTMQATLTWAETPKDLDIWVRKWECAQQINNRYGCKEKTTKTCAGNRHDMVYDDRISRVERDSCAKYDCERDVENDDATATDDWGRPDVKRHCLKNARAAQNQFHKWVMHGSRLVYRMDTELVSIDKTRNPWHGKGRPTAGLTGTWNADNWLMLDTDERYGWGPETVTFHNVPPGIYQVFVDNFRPENGEVDDIRKAIPSIELTLGSDGITVICEPDPKCKQNARSWHAADIQVLDDGLDEHDSTKRRYSIRILDHPERLKDVFRFEQPSESWDNDEHSRLKGRDRDAVVEDYKSGRTSYDWYQYHTNSGNGYSNLELSKICKGKCRLAEGWEDYAQCVDHEPW